MGELHVNDETINEAINLFMDFKNTVLYENRFFLKEHKVLDILEKRVVDERIAKGSILYRARIYKTEGPSANAYYLEHLKKDSPFKGYNAQDSMAPRRGSAKIGRINPAMISYLYTAREMETAIYEVKPNLNNEVSVAYIKTLKEVKVADISMNALKKTADWAMEDYVLYFVTDEFSKVCNNAEEDYILTQYISNFFKIKEYDAIEFNSSLYKYGKNITIFDPSYCEAVASDLYNIKSISIEHKLLKSGYQAMLETLQNK